MSSVTAYCQKNGIDEREVNSIPCRVYDIVPQEHYSNYFVEGILNKYNNQQIKNTLQVALPNYKPTSRKGSIKKLALWYLNEWGEFKW